MVKELLARKALFRIYERIKCVLVYTTKDSQGCLAVRGGGVRPNSSHVCLEISPARAWHGRARPPVANIRASGPGSHGQLFAHCLAIFCHNPCPQLPVYARSLQNCSEPCEAIRISVWPSAIYSDPSLPCRVSCARPPALLQPSYA